MWNRGSWGGLGWQPAESIGQWVSFGEGRFDSTTRFLTRSLERARERSGRSPYTRREFYLFDRSRMWKREHYRRDKPRGFYRGRSFLLFFHGYNNIRARSTLNDTSAIVTSDLGDFTAPIRGRFGEAARHVGWRLVSVANYGEHT